MKRYYIQKFQKGCEPQFIGNKAQSLLFLTNQRLLIPETWVCPWNAYLDAQKEPDLTKQKLRDEICSTLNMHQLYAVRSSCNREDSVTFSYAGIFHSLLNVSGADKLIDAVQSVWNSARNECANVYHRSMGIDKQGMLMAVIIQEMVPAILSGVVFTRNPVTGADEIIIEAVTGSGEMLMQKGSTPSRWIIRSGKPVRTAGENILSEDVINEIIRQTKKVAAARGRAVDMEWAYDGSRLYWLQERAVTTVRTVDCYTNYFSREFLPGMIKPLVWSINIPVVNSAWKKLLTELIGPNDIDINRLARAFYYRAYFNTGVIGNILEKIGFASETLETILGFNPDVSKKIPFKPTLKTAALLPRIILFILTKVRLAGTLKQNIENAQTRFKELYDQQITGLIPNELLANIRQLCAFTTQTAYFNIAAWLNMSIYSRILKVLFKRHGVDIKNLDIYCGIKGLDQFDPISDMKSLSRELGYLEKNHLDHIKACSFNEFMNLPGIAGLQCRIRGFLDRFGYLSDCGNDFSAVQWHEQPDVILHMLLNYPTKEARNTISVDACLQRLPVLHRFFAAFFLRQARTFKFYKEAVSATHNYGYSLFRKYFLALAENLEARGHLRRREDIFLLSFDEIGRITGGHTTAGETLAKIESRQRELNEFKQIALPEVIYGDQTPPRSSLPVAGMLRGIAASGGYYSGRVKVVRGIKEFDKLEKGDVLVIPYSDVGLTPLFAKASAVVAEAGGMLCHSSIIAREYGIPAVTAVPQACLLADNTLVTVDGYRGAVLVHA